MLQNQQAQQQAHEQQQQQQQQQQQLALAAAESQLSPGQLFGQQMITPGQPMIHPGQVPSKFHCMYIVKSGKNTFRLFTFFELFSRIRSCGFIAEARNKYYILTQKIYYSHTPLQ